MNIVIVGAGPAGLMAAAIAAQHAASSTHPIRVLVLEKNRKAGVKILMSGGTRCNLTHHCGNDGIMEAFGANGKFLRQALDHLSPGGTVELFHRLGVPTEIEPVTDKIFPASNRAIDVRDALLRYATQSGAEVMLGTAVKSIVREVDSFAVRTTDSNPSEPNGISDREIRADRLILTSGGRSYPGCGTIGEGYEWLQAFGHQIVPPRPALVPLVGGETWMRELSGVTLERAAASVWQRPSPDRKPAKRPLIRREGSFLFTHLGFSGPTAMDVSGTITGGGFAETLLTLDMLPSMTSEQIETRLEQGRRSEGKRRVLAAVSQWVPKRIAEAICTQSGTGECSFGELPRDSANKLTTLLKALPLPVTGTRGYEKAEVTAGGLSLKEVDPRTMQSRMVPGLYIAGELLDLDGWIGGYNFQAAFSTGHVAGMSAVQSLGEALSSKS